MLVGFRHIIFVLNSQIELTPSMKLELIGIKSEYEIPMYYGIELSYYCHHIIKEEAGHPRMDDRKTINEYYFLLFTYRLSVECSF
jgi:hypothetical protein